jgi:hypothetical protein
VRTQVLASGQQSAAVTSGQGSAEAGDHGSIGPADPWPRLAALQNWQLTKAWDSIGSSRVAYRCRIEPPATFGTLVR